MKYNDFDDAQKENFPLNIRKANIKLHFFAFFLQIIRPGLFECSFDNHSEKFLLKFRERCVGDSQKTQKNYNFLQKKIPFELNHSLELKKQEPKTLPKLFQPLSKYSLLQVRKKLCIFEFFETEMFVWTRRKQF